MTKTFFTSDLHLGHKNIISYDNRPFTNVKDMNSTLITNWNNTVSTEDTVYILGDFSWMSIKDTLLLLKQLNGQKHLIKGNHDRVQNKELQGCFVSITDYKELKIEEHFLVLCHYPMPFFNRHHHGAIHLYGHVHNSQEWHITENIKTQLNQLGIPCRMFNVGCMLWGYNPVTLEEILKFEEKNITKIEDH